MVADADPLAELGNVEWRSLSVAYDAGARIPAILRLLGSEDPTAVEWGWEQLSEQILMHQGTVYPGTVAAAPFLARLVAKASTLRRPRMLHELAAWTTGTDAPHSPPGTTKELRNCVRRHLHLLADLQTTPDLPLQLAMASLAAAMPFDLADCKGQVAELFANAGDRATRTALAGALAMLGDEGGPILDALYKAEQRSMTRAERGPEGLVIIWPKTGPHAKPDAELEDVAMNPVYTTVMTWRSGTAPGDEGEAFLAAARAVHGLFDLPTIWHAP